MDSFVVKESQVSSNNHISFALDSNVDNDPRDGDPQTENNVRVEKVSIGSTNIEIVGNGANVGATCTNVEMDDNNNGDSFQPDIFDPRYWDSLDTKQIDILAQKGPKRDLSIQKGPRDRYSRRFSALFYYRKLPNGQYCDRDWLVYSQELDRVFCFGCKLFTKGY